MIRDAHGLASGLRFADRAITRLNSAGTALAAVFLVVIVVVGVADVIGTNLFGAPVPSALEISQYGMVFIAFGGLAYALQRGTHVAVDLFVRKMPNPVRNLAHGVALIIAFVVFGFVGWRAGIAAIQSFSIGEQSSGLFRFPLYPAKAAVSLGCALAVLESARQFVRLCAKHPDKVDHIRQEEQAL